MPEQKVKAQARRWQLRSWVVSSLASVVQATSQPKKGVGEALFVTVCTESLMHSYILILCESI